MGRQGRVGWAWVGQAWVVERGGRTAQAFGRRVATGPRPRFTTASTPDEHHVKQRSSGRWVGNSPAGPTLPPESTLTKGTYEQR